MRFGVLIGTTDSHVSPLAPGRGDCSEFLRNAGFSLTTRIWGSGGFFGPDAWPLPDTL